MGENPGQVFLRYSFPCAHLLLQNQDITQAEFDKLESATFNGTEIPEKELEDLFPNAFRRLRVIAEEKGMEYWTPELIRIYFRNHHDRYIDSNDGGYANAALFTPTLKDLCRVRIGKITEVTEIRGHIMGRASIEDKVRPVILDLIEDPHVGDKVYVHQAFAVEKA